MGGGGGRGERRKRKIGRVSANYNGCSCCCCGGLLCILAANGQFWAGLWTVAELVGVCVFLYDRASENLRLGDRRNATGCKDVLLEAAMR